MGQTNRSGVDVYEKAPARQPVGQTTPEVDDDIVSKLLRNTKPDIDREVERMAGEVFDTGLDIPSIAKESTKTKYGAGQLSKTPGSHYLGSASI
jgi:hypothetical protein